MSLITVGIYWSPISEPTIFFLMLVHFVLVIVQPSSINNFDSYLNYFQLCTIFFCKVLVPILNCIFFIRSLFPSMRIKFIIQYFLSFVRNCLFNVIIICLFVDTPIIMYACSFILFLSFARSSFDISLICCNHTHFR